MSRGINKVILIGNLGADPEVRYTPSGTAVTTISLATSNVWKDKETGSPQEKTEWHRVVLFNRLAEIAGQFLKKASKIYIEGSLRSRKWQDKTGQDRYTTEIVASDLQMLDSKGSGGAASNPSMTDTGGQPFQLNSEEGTAKKPSFDTVESPGEDDIPF